MEKIPTIEEFLPKNSNGMYSRNEVEKAVIEFTRRHVEAAVKAKGNAMTEKSYEDSSYSMTELDSFTRNCYPLENIK